MRQLAQPATNHYLTRIRDAIEHYRPGLPVVHPGPTPWRSDAYPIGRSHPDAVRAAAAWADRNDCRFLDLDPLVGPMHEAGAGNPDGLHWNWPTHRSVGLAVGQALAEVIR